MLGLLGSAAMIWVMGAQVMDWHGSPMAGDSLCRPDADDGLPLAARPAPAEGPVKAPPLDPALDDVRAIQSHLALKPVSSKQVLADSLDISKSETPIGQALAAIEDCQVRYREVRDYTCTFSKRERIKGQLTPRNILTMKVRAEPRSIYLRFREPTAGREAIYIVGKHNGKVLAHDVGLGRLIAGTLHLDPNGDRAMAESRHPISEAGIGPLLQNLETRWSSELDPSESVVVLRDDRMFGDRRCTMIETTHPERRSEFLFYKVFLYIDDEIGLPVHFEAYDWPATPECLPEMVEEYSYTDLKLNVGLSDLDFDVSNKDYSFGRY